MINLNHQMQWRMEFGKRDNYLLNVNDNVILSLIVVNFIYKHIPRYTFPTLIKGRRVSIPQGLDEAQWTVHLKFFTISGDAKTLLPNSQGSFEFVFAKN